jgi:hypothetical protein
MHITPEYKALQTAFHESTPDYGISGSKHAEPVRNFSEKLQTRDILDYGCGKQTLQRSLPFPIQNYDPCIPECSKRPVPADLVVCTDVLEHVEKDCIYEVLKDLLSLTKRVLFLNVSTRPARKILPDGRNAHILIQPSEWWLALLMAFFHVQSFQDGPGEFTALLTPKVDGTSWEDDIIPECKQHA